MQGRCGQAVDSFERALGLARQIGDRNGEFEAHQGLGRVHLAAGSHHNEEPEVTSTAVRAHLHELEHLSAAG
ncbi:MAG TPA: hypothetical protein VFW65_05490 [Pseudonocardiaceae bacterium]|nr:hypothetical protein [Pseudonocardiaceae bacterium]